MNSTPDLSRAPSGRALAALAIALATASCAAPPQRQSGFLKDYSVLGKSSYENVLLYRAPAFDPTAYSKVALEPARITGDTPELRALAPELKRDILAHIDKELAQRVAARGATSLAEGKTLRVRAAISEVETPNRAVNWATTLLVGTVTRGGASLEVELSDASTGELLVAATCSERGHPLWDQFDGYTLLGHARLAVTECMKRFEQAYVAAK